MAYRFFSRVTACATALLVVGAASAQFDFGNAFASTPPWEQFKLDPKKTLKLEFRNSSIDMVVAVLSKASGVTIVKDPGLAGQLTISTPKAVSLSEAFSIVNSALGLKNAEIVKEGSHLVVRQRPQRGGRGGGQDGGMPQGFDFGRMMEAFQPPQLELRVYPIKYANAAQVARVVNDVFAMQAGNQGNPLQMFLQQFGQQQGGPGGQFGRGRFGGGFPGMFGGGQQRGGNVRASSDDYSNSVIVNASRREHEQVEEIIKQIDQPTEAPMQSRVYKLQYANAQDIAPVVQNVLISNAPKGRGGTGNQQVPFEQRFGAFMRFGGNSQAAFGSVVAETRTNSVVVTATDENLKLVDQLMKELDQPVEYAETTFVFPLLNARADQISTLLNQTFGGRATGTGTFNQRTNAGQTRTNTTNRRTNPGGAGLGAGGGALGRSPQTNNEDPNMLELALEDPESDQGELQTQIGFQGGFFGGQFGQRQNSQTRQPGQTTARDEEGRLINVRDLTGQVTVIPDPNTNSLIVVTNPDNVELLKRILDQLDRIPEQVMIETIIVEASLDSADKLGVEWTFTERNAFGSTGQTAVGQQRFGLQNANPPLEGLRYTMTGGNLEAFLNMLKTDQRFEVLSTPRIFTSNNSTAEINISQSVPYVLSSRVDTNGNISYNYAFQDVGIILNVTPRITADGYVTMDIVQTANDLQGFTSFNAPIVNQRQANTTVAVKDGETVILGGIIRSTVTATTKKIPLLGDIPFLGNLFRSTDRSKSKTELLVFLTPRVVRNPEDAKKLQEQQRGNFSEPTRKALDKVVGPIQTSGNGVNGEKTGGNRSNDSNKGGTN